MPAESSARLRDFSWIQDDGHDVLNVGKKLRQPPRIPKRPNFCDTPDILWFSSAVHQPNNQPSFTEMTLFEDMLADVPINIRRQQSHAPNDPKSPVFCQRKKRYCADVGSPSLRPSTCRRCRDDLDGNRRWNLGNLRAEKKTEDSCPQEGNFCAGKDAGAHLTPESIPGHSSRSDLRPDKFQFLSKCALRLTSGEGWR